MTEKRLYSAILAIALIINSLPAIAGASTIKVRKGDTLWVLARKHHTTPRKIAQANGISENAVIGIGRTLRIPSISISQSPSRTRRHRAEIARSTTKPTAIGAGSNTSEVSTASSSLVRTALACRGMRYRRGGTSRGGFDCSGFTRYIYSKYGRSLPHSSAAQARVGHPVSRGGLQPGDLVFFQTYRRGISHVGIYVGNSSFVHAARHGKGVRVDSLGSGYYARRYRGARRLDSP